MNKKNTNRIYPHQKKNRYYNHSADILESFLFHTLPSFVGSLFGRKKRLSGNVHEWMANDVPLAQSSEPVITWIGHSTFLIQLAGYSLITDPIFGNVSLLFKRQCPPGIPLENMPAVDCILISHNHRDHCDIASLKQLQARNPHSVILVPCGDKRRLEKKGLKNIREYEWWQASTFFSTTENKPITITFLPAWHWSGTGLFDWNSSLWGSWMIQSQEACIYFAGDTAYSEHFKHIGAEFPHITTALLPIGPIKPHPHMRRSHIDADQAVQACVDLKAQQLIPMHWGTFQFGNDAFIAPIERLKAAWDTHPEVGGKKCTLVKFGQKLVV